MPPTPGIPSRKQQIEAQAQSAIQKAGELIGQAAKGHVPFLPNNPTLADTVTKPGAVALYVPVLVVSAFLGALSLGFGIGKSAQAKLMRDGAQNATGDASPAARTAVSGAHIE